jgi:glycerol-3-phosphate acyltransferase PlsX
MRIGVDAMGGDYAPLAIVAGAVEAQKQLVADERIVLFGDEKIIISTLQELKANPTDFDIVHCTEVIEMGDNPAKALVKKPDSSIAVGLNGLQVVKSMDLPVQVVQVLCWLEQYTPLR